MVMIEIVLVDDIDSIHLRTSIQLGVFAAEVLTLQ